MDDEDFLKDLEKFSIFDLYPQEMVDLFDIEFFRSILELEPNSDVVYIQLNWLLEELEKLEEYYHCQIVYDEIVKRDCILLLHEKRGH